jgi:hypothetical protein
MHKKLLYVLILAAVVVGFTQCQSGPGVIKEMVGWWKFDETSGAAGKDASGKSKPIDFKGDVKWEKGKIGNCVTLNGTDTFGFVEGNFKLATYTISVWFKADKDTMKRMDIVSAYAPGVMHGMLLEISLDATLRYLHRFPLGQSGGVNINTEGEYRDGKWHHVALVKTAKDITIYVDGVVGATSEELSEDPGEPFNVAVGCLDNERALDRVLNGSIDDLRLYDGALSADQVKELFNVGGK